MSDLVKRYNFRIDGMADCYCDTEENSQGDYVDYEDYKQLEASNAKLRAVIESLNNAETPEEWERIMSEYTRPDSED